MSELGEYQYSLHHKLGKSNVKPDILSRQLNLERGKKTTKTLSCLKQSTFDDKNSSLSQSTMTSSPGSEPQREQKIGSSRKHSQTRRGSGRNMTK
jgi:hypothetical protein